MAQNTDKPQVFSNAAEELAAIELSIKKAQLEDLELQKEERRLNMQDVKARLDERKIKDLQKKQDREAQGKTFASQAQTDAIRQKSCTHKKGGVVSARNMSALSTGGNGQQFAVIKHQMINGDIWVRCLRCAKTWVPPQKEKFFFDAKGKQAPADGPQAGVFDVEKYKEAVADYHRAVSFETNNSMSGSVQCKFLKYNEETGEWVDASADYRKSVIDTNLR